MLVDNDVILKICRWRLNAAFVSTVDGLGAQPMVTTASYFVVRSRLEKARDEGAIHSLAEVWSLLTAVELDAEELETAALLESEAMNADVELDAGESQLLALITHRGNGRLLTGDKRAITAIEKIAASKYTKLVACLEQLIVSILAQSDGETVRSSICAHVGADRAVEICMSCHRLVCPQTAELIAGLSSYVDALRHAAPTVLIDGADLGQLFRRNTA